MDAQIEEQKTKGNTMTNEYKPTTGKMKCSECGCQTLTLEVDVLTEDKPDGGTLPMFEVEPPEPQPSKFSFPESDIEELVSRGLIRKGAFDWYGKLELYRGPLSDKQTATIASIEDQVWDARAFARKQDEREENDGLPG